jgi:enoyl-CoA hydratase/carnithine racemase
MFDHLALARDAAVAVVTIDRPHVLNALFDEPTTVFKGT